DLRPHIASAQDGGASNNQLPGHVLYSSVGQRKVAASCLEAGGRESNQFLRGMAPVGGLGDPGRTLDQAEICHGIGQRAAKEVQAPVQLLLVQVRQAGREGAGELALHVSVLVGQEL